MTLKNAMNYPSDLALDVDTVVPPVQDMLTEESVSAIQDYAMANNPTALQAAFQLKASKMNYLITKENYFRLFPSKLESVPVILKI